MIAIERVLSLREYRQANLLVLRHGTLRRRIGYWTWRWAVPVMGGCVLLWSIWKAVSFWRMAGQHGTQFALCCALAVYSGLAATLPLWWRWRSRRLYLAQELDRSWRLEIAERGAHSLLEGRFDSWLDWAYFDAAIESPELFLLVKRARLMFVSIPKHGVRLEVLEELRAMVRAKGLPIIRAG